MARCDPKLEKGQFVGGELLGSLAAATERRAGGVRWTEEARLAGIAPLVVPAFGREADEGGNGGIGLAL